MIWARFSKSFTGTSHCQPAITLFALPSPSFPYTLYIHGRTVDAIVMAVTIDEAAVSHGARLDLMDVAAVPAVQKFEAPEMGLTLIYWTPKRKRLGSKEAQQKSVPQGASASQVTENKNIRRGLHG